MSCARPLLWRAPNHCRQFFLNIRAGVDAMIFKSIIHD
jgi:hypothetical protein